MISTPSVSMIIMMTGWPIMRRSATRSISRPSTNMPTIASGIATQIGSRQRRDEAQAR